ncbi:fatty acid-binding protein-like [Homarus americanus]|uniref:fatty acid-binding protein-like n=1 Tax=Homarus americanus TaxID=6706 RepID=UPI001C48D127|nr:fatty acid-binding protein-like [Homarus americanus]XP_042215645.1 fatty acid-binding protein-like [Homarus americanus]
MVQFIGTYKHESDENLEEVFIKMGMGFLMRKLALRSKPTVEVEVDGDTWTITTKVTVRTMIWTFKLGEETFVDSTEGTVKVVFSVEDDKLIQTPVENQGDRVMTSVRHFTSDGLIQTLTHTASGTVATRHYKRV